MRGSYFNPLAFLFSSLTEARDWCYKKSILKSVSLKIPVVSVGNITMGGTGKTPFTHWLLSEVSGLGYRPGVVLRSYRASASEAQWVSTGPGSALEYGDEAVLLKLKNPSTPILSGPQKWESALKMEVEKKNEVNVILVDDGFQHRRLKRDLDIVLLDASVPLKDYQWPPIGRARESLRSCLARADVLVWTRWEQRETETVEYLKTQLNEFFLRPFPEFKKETRGRTDCEPIVELYLNQRLEPLRWIGGQPLKEEKSSPHPSPQILAFCGLGNPNSFFRSLEAQGLSLKERKVFPDHAVYDSERIRQLVELGRNFDYLITSEKDMVKLQEWPFSGPSLCVAPLSIHIEGNLEGFREKLARTLWSNN